MIRKIGELVKEFLEEKGWLAGNPYGPLFQQWARIAGASLAPHARLVDVRNSILIVEVDHPGWLQMLRLRQDSLLEAARKTIPHVPVEGIRVRVGERGTADH